MKIIKRIFAILLIYILNIIFAVSVSAQGPDIAAGTGDREIIGIVIAAVACIATAVITLKLTKNKNKFK